MLTKVLQRPRLGAYLEQSTRYIAYDAPMPGGGYRYYRDPELGPEYERRDGRAVRHLRRAAAARDGVGRARFPRADGEPEAARARAVKAKALDLLRGLLPAASLSHMGIFATGQTYEQLILHLLAHPLPEAQRYGEMILAAMKAMIPSFVTRVERPDRGGRGSTTWQRAGGGRALGCAAGARGADPADARARRCGCCTSTATRTSCSRRCCSRPPGPARSARAPRSRAVDAERAALLRDLVGERENRRHRPGRGFEALRYRFEIVSDYGAFRDLQRHRMLTCQWQALSPDLGAGVPEEVDGRRRRRRLPRARSSLARRVRAPRRTPASRDAAPYALCLGYRIRYVLDLNAREAMQLIELRSGREGHPAYRAVAHEMHAQIAARPPRGGGGDDPRRPRRGAPAGADPVRDAPGPGPARAG